eukprot:m51a1_g8405 hypothetical protein (433) ;mRNA; f:249493-250845
MGGACSCRASVRPIAPSRGAAPTRAPRAGKRSSRVAPSPSPTLPRIASAKPADQRASSADAAASPQNSALLDLPPAPSQDSFLSPSSGRRGRGHAPAGSADSPQPSADSESIFSVDVKGKLSDEDARTLRSLFCESAGSGADDATLTPEAARAVLLRRYEVAGDAFGREACERWVERNGASELRGAAGSRMTFDDVRRAAEHARTCVELRREREGVAERVRNTIALRKKQRRPLDDVAQQAARDADGGSGGATTSLRDLRERLTRELGSSEGEQGKGEEGQREQQPQESGTRQQLRKMLEGSSPGPEDSNLEGSNGTAAPQQQQQQAEQGGRENPLIDTFVSRDEDKDRSAAQAQKLEEESQRKTAGDGVEEEREGFSNNKLMEHFPLRTAAAEQEPQLAGRKSLPPLQGVQPPVSRAPDPFSLNRNGAHPE